MNRMPDSHQDFDRHARQLQQQADAALSAATLARLRQARQQASTANAPSTWRRHRWWLATACSLLLAVPVALQFNTSTPPAAPVLASNGSDAGDDTLLLDESPELYLWLGSDNLAME
ncbi:hypothetical protein ABB27_10885 [Stenotrophomonas terrae]|uniref:Uncharacterized protein n=2 Tax=Stenotrophomonas terrae TaxID=405446 RepID=A0A0R0CDH3_9GAMM|nr:hypothetical protein ABB27_10885 [Stenotrophomonas terrae]